MLLVVAGQPLHRATLTLCDHRGRDELRAVLADGQQKPALLELRHALGQVARLHAAATRQGRRRRRATFEADDLLHARGFIAVGKNAQ